MGNLFNDDFRDFLFAFNKAEVEYILLGGYSVIIHGYSRTTGDMDIWVKRTPENYFKIKKGFLNFGMPVFQMTEENFLNHPSWDVFSFGRPPSSIDIMVKVKGMDFDNCYNQAFLYEDDGLIVKTISYNDLIKAKKAASRPKDLDDLENLL